MGKSKLYPVYFLLVLTALYAMTKWLNVYTNDIHPFFRNHFPDLLFIPTQMTICLIVLRFLKQSYTLLIPIALVFVLTILMAILFEWYLPVYKNSIYQTADIVDAVMYLVGAGLFLFIQKKWFQQGNRANI
jgi:FtsH-binding integral membrane protein